MAQIGFVGERIDIILRRGTTLGPFVVTLTNKDATPVDLTGCTIEGEVRKNALDQGSPVAVFSIDYIDRPAGKFSFGMAYDVTATIPAGEYQKDDASQYVWSLRLNDSASRRIPLYHGSFENFVR